LGGTQVLAASAQRTAFLQKMLALLERHDVLALPSAQVWPFDAALRWPKRIGDREMDTYHRWMEVTLYATFAGLPAISVPAGFSAEGWPMGLQLIGKPHGEEALLGLAHAYEQAAAEVLSRKPPAATS
jgi:amidase